jgi:hypothetical protein
MIRGHLFSGAFAKLRKATVSFVLVCLSARMQHLGSHWTDFHEISYLSIFRKSVENVQVALSLAGVTGTLHEDQYTFLIISRTVILRIRNVSHKIFTENQNTHFMFSGFYRKSCRL